jgi:hypothetical protein
MINYYSKINKAIFKSEAVYRGESREIGNNVGCVVWARLQRIFEGMRQVLDEK